MKPRFPILALSLALVSACGGPQRQAPQSYAEQAEYAFAQAEEALDDGNHPYALGLYRQVRDSFELSPLAVLAELRIADVYFEQGSFLQAAQAYRQFISLHPTHGAVGYARFRIGMAFYEDMPSDFFILPAPHERELGSTRSASQALGRFLEEYGDSQDPDMQGYIGQAREAHQEALDRLAGYEFYLAEFYLERERPVAAANHLVELLDEYPGSTFQPEAMFLLARCYVELDDVIGALEAIKGLSDTHPGHRLTARALGWMDSHQLSFTELPVE